MDANDTRNAELERLTLLMDHTNAIKEDLERTVSKREISAWESDSRNCKKCNNTGSVLTWWTLDGSGWDEHGECPDCHGVTATIGLRMNPAVTGVDSSSRFGNVRSFDHLCSMFGTDVEKATQESLREEAAGVKYEIDCLEDKSFKRGDIVVITKGRKFPIGLVGSILALRSPGDDYDQGNYNPYATYRALIQLAATLPGKPATAKKPATQPTTRIWVNVENLGRAVNVPEEQIQDLKVVLDVEARDYKAKQDATRAEALKTIGKLPALVGSIKQVEWASKIRDSAIMKGAASEIVTSKLDAKWWIEVGRYSNWGVG